MVAFVVFGGGVFSGVDRRQPASTSPVEEEAEVAPEPLHSKVEAYVYCKMLVRNSLKAPATAVFPRESYTDVTVDQGGGRYSVRSYVDAENSFGALIRSRYECTVKSVGRKRYEVVNLVIG